MSFVRSYLGLQAILLIQQNFFTLQHVARVSAASGRYTNVYEIPKILACEAVEGYMTVPE